MTRYKVDITDLTTGEIMPPGTIIAPRLPRSPNFSFPEGDFIMTALSGARLLARTKLTQTATRLLWELIGSSAFGNDLRKPQQEIAADLGVDRADISRALAELEAHNIIQNTGTYCRVKTWRLNPDHFWRGSPHSHRDAVAENKTRRKRLKLVHSKPEQPAPQPPAAPTDNRPRLDPLGLPMPR